MGNSKNTHIFFMRLTYMDSLDTLYYYEGVNFFLLRHKDNLSKKEMASSLEDKILHSSIFCGTLGGNIIIKWEAKFRNFLRWTYCTTTVD